MAAGPPGGGGSSSTTLAVIAHLGSVFGGFLVPLIIFLTADKRDRYLRHHASEGLNFQITVMIASFGALAVFFVAMVAGMASLGAGEGGGVAAFFGGFAVLWVGILVISFGSLILSIVGAIRASQGVWWRYPVCLRLVRGPGSPDEEAGLGVPVG